MDNRERFPVRFFPIGGKHQGTRNRRSRLSHWLRSKTANAMLGYHDKRKDGLNHMLCCYMDNRNCDGFKF